MIKCALCNKTASIKCRGCNHYYCPNHLKNHKKRGWDWNKECEKKGAENDG